MKLNHLIRYICLILILIPLTSCASKTSIEPSPTPTNIPTQPQIKPSPTPTPTLIGALSPDKPELPQKLTGELEVRFPHPFGGTPEFCASFVPYQLDLVTGTYQLTG